MHTAYVVLSLWGLSSLALFLAWIAYAELRLWRRRIRYRATGTLPDGGYRRPSASTGTKGRGTPTLEMAITEGSSFCSVRGPGWVDVYDLTSHRLVSSYTVRGVSTYATGRAGASGVPPERAD